MPHAPAPRARGKFTFGRSIQASVATSYPMVRFVMPDEFSAIPPAKISMPPAAASWVPQMSTGMFAIGDQALAAGSYAKPSVNEDAATPPAQYARLPTPPQLIQDTVCGYLA